LLANFGYWGARLAAGAIAGIRGRGEAARFPGAGGKIRIAIALLKGVAQAISMSPATLRKRRDMRPLRRLSPKQIRELLFRYRITLKELSERAI
jgi:hypothetical protein